MDHHVRHIVHQAEGDISDLAIVASVIHPGEGWALENEGGFQKIDTVFVIVLVSFVFVPLEGRLFCPAHRRATGAVDFSCVFLLSTGSEPCRAIDDHSHQPLSIRAVNTYCMYYLYIHLNGTIHKREILLASLLTLTGCLPLSVDNGRMQPMREALT